MIKNIYKNVFIINGGSFNPPHNGHIKMFKTAYDTLVAKETSADGDKPEGYYGIMVVSTRKYIMSKGLKDDEVLSSEDRIKLCKLACDAYNWGEDSKFNSNNMLILDVADSDPKALLLHKIVKILDASPAYKDKEKENKIIEIKLNVPGKELFAKKQTKSFEESTDEAIEALRKQLLKEKEKME